MKKAPLSKHPFRDATLIYAGFAVVFVVIVAATGGSLLPRIEHGDPFHLVIGAFPAAAGCFLLATGYSWWRIRKRLEAEEQES